MFGAKPIGLCRDNAHAGERVPEVIVHGIDGNKRCIACHRREHAQRAANAHGSSQYVAR